MFKNWKSPTTIIALVALFVALSGGVALAGSAISGKSILNHSIPLRKLTPGSIHRLHGQRGPRGPQGPIGNTGADGQQGIQGPAGVQGPVGPTGARGIQGIQGIQGVVGPVGPTGVQGVQGPSGPQGLSGPSGPSGPQGLSGPSGPQGDSGPSGPSGPAGPSGPSGPAGANGEPVYDTSGNLQSSEHTVIGTFTMPNSNGPSTVTMSGSAAFTSASSYVCTITDYTTVNAQAKLTRSSGTAFALTTMGPAAKNDVIGFICIGQ